MRVAHLPLMRPGIYPRTAAGLAGVLFAPLIHGSWGHLLSNSFALLILGTALRYGYPRARRTGSYSGLPAVGARSLVPGTRNYHIGASGLTHGMMFFIFTTGILWRDRPSIALALIVFFLFGGMVWSIFPPQPEKHYDWEDETAVDTDTGQEERPPEP